MSTSTLRHFTSPAVTALLSISMWIMIAPVSRAEDNTSLVEDGTTNNFGSLLIIGDTGTNNTLTILNAGVVINSTGVVGNASTATDNSVLVSGPGSTWSNTSRFFLGATGSYNQVTITNGGRLFVQGGGNNFIGRTTASGNNSLDISGTNSSFFLNGDLRLGPGASNRIVVANGAQVTSTAHLILGDTGSASGHNTAIITGSNSVYNIGSSGAVVFWIGRASTGNQLILTNGGRVVSFTSSFGEGAAAASNNTAIVTGQNSLWDVRTSLIVNRNGQRLQIDDGGTVKTPTLTVGVNATLTNNLIEINGGNLFVTNAASTATYDMRRGSNVLNSGTLTVDRLVFTNGASSVLQINGGTLNTKDTTVSNTSVVSVGDGVSAATLNLLGGTHTFADGLAINTNSVLKGTGTVIGDTTVHGTLAPGNSPGLLSLGNLTLQSNSNYEVEIDGLTAGTDYDQVGVTGFVNLSNSLLQLAVGFQPSLNDTFTIIDNDDTDAVLGTFLGLDENAFIDASSTGIDAFFRISYVGGTGNDVVLIASIPEPATSVFALTALLGWLVVRRKHSSPRVA